MYYKYTHGQTNTVEENTQKQWLPGDNWITIGFSVPSLYISIFSQLSTMHTVIFKI